MTFLEQLPPFLYIQLLTKDKTMKEPYSPFLEARCRKIRGSWFYRFVNFQKWAFLYLVAMASRKFIDKVQYWEAKIC